MKKGNLTVRGRLALCVIVATAFSGAAPTAAQAGDGAEIRALVADAASLQRLIAKFRKKPVKPTPAAPARIVEPLPYWNEIQRASRRFAVPAPLIAAVIRCESDWDPRALSPAGARGLMQVMPATALGTFGARPGTLWEPEANIELGTAYLRVLANRYQGHLRSVLAAYNAGPDRVDTGRALPTETRRYVRCVVTHYPRYVQHLRRWGVASEKKRPHRLGGRPGIIRVYSQESFR